MKESGEQWTVVFALVVTEPASLDHRNIVITKLRLSRHRNFELLCTFRDILITRNYA